MNLWKGGTLLVAGIGLLPLWLAWIAVVFIFKLLLGAIGFRPAHRDRSLIDEIFSFHLVGRLLEAPPPLSIVHYTVNAGARLAQVRQEGHFVDGMVNVGDEVQLHGQWRAGVFHVENGVVLTTGARITLPSNPWRTAFWIALVVVAIEWAWLILAAAGPNGAPR